MSVTGWITSVIAALVVALAALVGHAAARPSRPCRSCAGLGLRRGPRGGWTGFCGRCGGGQIDSWSTRALVAASRGRWLPRAGTVAAGRQHGQGFRFAGRPPAATGGPHRPRRHRLVALLHRRVPAAQRLVERRERAHAAARGLAKIWTLARLAAARRALRRAEHAAERHADALADHTAGSRAARRSAPRRARRR